MSGFTLTDAITWSVPWALTPVDIINAAAVECGLSTWTDPVASTDVNAVKLETLLNSLGRELYTRYDLAVMRRRATLTTAISDTGDYPLPTDWYCMIDQTGWKRNTIFPMDGPISSQTWEYLLNRVGSATVTAMFRENQGVVQIFPRPVTSVYTLTLQYRSRYWVMSSGQTAPDKALISAGTDQLLFEPALLVKGLKFSFLNANGLDAAQAYREFQEALDATRSAEAAAKIRMDSQGIFATNRFLDWANVPNTGFGP